MSAITVLFKLLTSNEEHEKSANNCRSFI